MNQPGLLFQAFIFARINPFLLNLDVINLVQELTSRCLSQSSQIPGQPESVTFVLVMKAINLYRTVLYKQPTKSTHPTMPCSPFMRPAILQEDKQSKERSPHPSTLGFEPRSLGSEDNIASPGSHVSLCILSSLQSHLVKWVLALYNTSYLWRPGFRGRDQAIKPFLSCGDLVRELTRTLQSVELHRDSTLSTAFEAELPENQALRAQLSNPATKGQRHPSGAML